MRSANALPTTRSTWSLPFAFAIAIVPIVGAIVAAWIELRELGESPMWLAAGAFFLTAPGVAAVAADRSRDPTILRVTIALMLFGALLSIWILNVPEPTRPGVYMGGGSRFSGTVMSAFAAIAWFVATSRALWLVRRGRSWLGLALGAIAFGGLGVVAFVAGSFV